MSYPVPKLSSIDGIGWSKWIDKLLGTAFMAPIFMFFMYLIAKISKVSILPKPDVSSMEFIPFLLMIIIPSMIYIILLMKATEYAKKGSGQLGSVVTAGIGLVAGMTAGGVALAGRKTVGTFIKGASTGDTAASRVTENARIMYDRNQNWISRGSATAKVALGGLQQVTGFDAARQRIGNNINADQHRVTHAAHARKDLDDAANTATHGAKKRWEDLTGEERNEARINMQRDRIVMANAGDRPVPIGAEGYVAGISPLRNRKWKDLSIAEKALINAVVDAQVAARTTRADTVTIPDARVKQGLTSSLKQSTVDGTYDIRNLANLMVKEQTTGFTKLTTGLTSAFTKSFRGAFSSAGIDFGKKPEGVFLKDLGSTITEALKNVKISVDLSSVGAEEKEGGGHGGGGGHH